MSKRQPPLDVDYAQYDELRIAGGSAEQACELAMRSDKDFSFQIRMLRSVYELDLVGARDVVAQLRYST